MNQLSKRAAMGTLLAASLLTFGCGDDEDFDFPFNPIGLQPPVAVNDSYSLTAGSQLNVASGQGVLVNDTRNQATISQFQTTSARGGIVVLNPDGSFVYTPPGGQANVSDTFTYTLDNGFGTSTATVTLQIGGQGFFVKNDAPAGGNGSQQFPFNTLAGAVAAANGVAGAEIVVFRGNGTSSGQSGAVTLQAGQTLRGFAAGDRPVITGPVNLANNSTLADVQVVGSAGSGVVATGVSGVTLRNVAVNNSVGDGLTLTNLTGTNTFQSVSIAGTGDMGVDYSQNAGTATLNWTGLTLTGATRDGVNIVLSGAGTTNWNETGSRLNTPSTAPLGAFGNGYLVNVGVNAGDTAVWNARFSDVVVNQSSRIGMQVFSLFDTRVTYVFDGGGIRNGPSRGFSLNALDDSTFLARISNTDTNTNAPGVGFEATSNNTAELCLRFINVVSDVYRFGQNQPTANFRVENLGTPPTFAPFEAENDGIVSPFGTITNAAIGECGIP